MNIGILLAAGKSERFKKDKLFVLINDKPVIFYSLKFLEESPRVDEIFIAVNKKNKKNVENFVKKSGFKKIKKIFLGGPSRFVSVTKVVPHILRKIRGLNFLIIHNVANPLATQEELFQCVNTLKRNTSISGVAVGREIHTTIKQTKSLSWNVPAEIERTIPRQNLWEVETPQVVRARDFIEACEKFAPHGHGKFPPSIREKRANFTDDLSVLEAAGKKTVIVEASRGNKKLTIPEDIELLRFFSGELPCGFAVGIGEDSHEFREKSAAGRRVKRKYLVLGGVKIKNLPALEANSDGDVILHALCNAISSAFGGGSLGTYATKMCERGIKDSKKYLGFVLKKSAAKKYKIQQCSISIEAARPNIDKFAPVLKKSLCALLKISPERVGITATSGERLTPFGRGEAIKCVVVIICKHL